MTLPMLAITERSRPMLSRFMIASDGSRASAAATVVYIITEDSVPSPYLRVDRILERVCLEAEMQQEPAVSALTRDHLLPSASIGAYGVSSARILRDFNASADERRSAITEILDEIEQTGRSEGLASVCVPFVGQADQELSRVLHSRGYASFASAQVAWMDVKWNSFDAYLATLSSRRAYSIRRERRQVASAGITVELRELEPSDIPELERLRMNVLEKYHGPQIRTQPQPPSALAAAASERPGTPLVALASLDGELVGFMSALRFGDEVYCEQVGFDYERIAGVPVYFELVYYTFVQYAAENGVRSINYGTEALQAKLARGCRFETTHAFVRCLDKDTHKRFSDLAGRLRAAYGEFSE